jgi:predicted nucleic acid-binding protein
MSVAEAEQYLITVLRPLLAVHSSPAIYFAASRIAEKHRISWCDALIVAAAAEGQCERLYSEDFQHGRRLERRPGRESVCLTAALPHLSAAC